jgi:hypothetical protein
MKNFFLNNCRFNFLLKGKSYKKINKFIKKDQKYSSLIKQLQAALSKEYNK